MQAHQGVGGNANALLVRIAGAAATLARVQQSLAAHTAPEAVALATSSLAAFPLSVPLRLARAQASLNARDFLLAGSDASSVLRSVSPGVTDAPPEAYTLLARALVHVFPGPRGAGLADSIVRACLHAWGPDQATCGAHAAVTARATHAWDAAQRAAAVNDTEVAAQALGEVAEVCSHAGGPASPCATAAWAALCALHGKTVQRMSRGRDAGAGVWAAQGLVTCASAVAGLVGNATPGSAQAPGTAGVVFTARGWARLGTGDAAGGTADVTAARALLADAQLDGTPCLCLSRACEGGGEARHGGEGEHGASLDVTCEAALAWANDLEAALQAALAPPDFYMLLNVTAQDARRMGAAEWRDFLRRAYRRAALQWHPDKLAGQPLPPFVTGPEHMFLLLAEAFRVLSDAALRDDYDAGRPTASGGEPSRQGHRGDATGPGDETESPGGVWVFHFDKRDVDADGTVLGTWVRDADGARRQGRRPTPHPTRPPTSTSSPDGTHECGPHGARRRRCLAPGESEQQSRAAEAPGKVQPDSPDGFSAPLSPAPALKGRTGCYGAAQVVGNHFGLLAVHVEFSLVPPGQGDDGHGGDDPVSPGRGVKPGYGPRLSPGAIEALAASKRAADVGAVLVWTPSTLAAQSAVVVPGDLLVYELKWLGVDAEDETPGEEGTSGEGVPPAFVALDLRWHTGELLSRTGATDGRGLGAGPGVDLRGVMGDAAQAPGGWLERRIVLPHAGALDAVLLACAAPGAVTVRAAVRHVRIESPGGASRLVLLPGETADLGGVE